MESLRRRSQELERRKAKREGDRDHAEARLRESLRELKEEFGVGSVAEARQLVSDMESELAVMLRELDTKLREVER